MLEFEICLQIDESTFLFPALREPGTRFFMLFLLLGNAQLTEIPPENSFSHASLKWLSFVWKLDCWASALFCNMQVRLCSQYFHHEIYGNSMHLMDASVSFFFIVTLKNGSESVVTIQDANTVRVVVRGPKPRSLMQNIVKEIKKITSGNPEIASGCPFCCLKDHQVLQLVSRSPG